nr:hypothetical protein [Chloroflexota bacterium]
MEYNVIYKAIEWMLNRGWKQLTAKSRYFEQSLFEHALVELDALLQILPILRLPNHFNLSEEEERVLIMSLVAHDVGKERPEWQEYILGRRGFVPDIDPALTKKVVPDLAQALGFEGLNEQVIAVIENCVNLHMSGARGDANVVQAILQGTNRWYTLANIVYHIDNICSAKGVFEAMNALERSPLRKHLEPAYHQVVIRGVSTTMLHRAALESFVEAGWRPLLHFSNASLYVCSAAQRVLEPSASNIKYKLSNILEEATGREVIEFMVGSPVASIMPKPELFDYREVRQYLENAAKKIGRVAFAKKEENARKSTVTTYLTFKRLSEEGYELSKLTIKQAKGSSLWDEIATALSPSELALQTERISAAYPEMMVFKFFKAMMEKEIVGNEGAEIARKEYEAVFGPGSWAALLSTSTLMPAQDMAKTVDLFWKLPGRRFELSVTKVEELEPKERTELLIDTLTNIANQVYAAIEQPPTRATLAGEMAAGFVQDLVHPVEKVDLAELARHQLEFYAASKPVAGKELKNAQFLCPICNSPFESGTKAKADFINKPESHTNRAISHGPFGYVMICDTCKYERILRQLLLGERAKELIVIFPRMNIGPGAGELLVRKAQALYDKAYAIMTGETTDPDQRIWLAFTPIIASNILDRDIYRLTPEQLVDLLSYRTGEQDRRKNWRELSKAIKEAYGEDLEGANLEWGTEFATWEEAIDEVIANRVDDPTVRQIRAEVYGLRPQMKLVCQTPHMIMLPMTYSIVLGDDSETNAALRRVFVALLLGLALDASVAIVRDSEEIDFQGGEGVAYVPPVAAARALIGTNWVPIHQAERWLRAIGLASILASAGQYSERSGLFEVLTAPTLGHILRRIEQQREKDQRKFSYQDIAYLKAFGEVMPMVH